MEAAWDANFYRWTGFRTLVDPNDNLPPQMKDLIQSNPGPFFVTIQIGTDLSDFTGLLDEVSTAPLVGETLTESEIESLRRDEKEMSEYAKQAFVKLRDSWRPLAPVLESKRFLLTLPLTGGAAPDFRDASMRQI